MTVLEKILYIADYIEPMRDKAPRLGEIRKLAFSDLDECMYAILKDTITYLEQGAGAGEIDDASREAYAFYGALHERRIESGELSPGKENQQNGTRI